jgi:putative hemolysin
MLTPDVARRMGDLCSDAEFDLRKLHHVSPRMAELGRPAWLSGAVILMLWSTLAEFMHRNGLDLMVG